MVSNSPDCVMDSDSSCVIPAGAQIKDKNDVDSMLRTHEWKLESSSNYSKESQGVLVRLRCEKCRATWLMIIAMT